jgi:predicted CXXCH cytochrome family protein
VIRIPNSGEYASVATFGYDPLSPVARTDAAMTLLGNTPSASVAATSDMVMCLSCHRPHGSPYDDLLRWDYGDMVAGTDGPLANKGCFYCHSTKDGG